MSAVHFWGIYIVYRLGKILVRSYVDVYLLLTILVVRWRWARKWLAVGEKLGETRSILRPVKVALRLSCHESIKSRVRDQH